MKDKQRKKRKYKNDYIVFVYIAIETVDQQYQSVKLANETLVLINLKRNLENSHRGKKEINRIF